MSEMKLIMENWRAYNSGPIDEACRGSDCLKEYKVVDYLNDISAYTGFTQKLKQKLQKAIEENPQDTKLIKASKLLLQQISSAGAGTVIGLGVAGGLTMAIPGAAPALLAVAGGFLGNLLGGMTQEVISQGSGALQKMFDDAQTPDPPSDARGWILDLKDQIENLIKGGGENSPLYKDFHSQMLAEFEGVEQALKSALEGATQQNASAILQLPMSNFLRKGTASQMLQKYILGNSQTQGVKALHPDIT